jgi:hypothetical protein
VKDEFSGNNEDLFIALIQPTVAHVHAHALHDAMAGLGVDETTIINVLAAQEKSTCRQIADVYFQVFDKRLEDALKDELGGDLKRATLQWVRTIEPEFQKNGQPASPEEMAQSLSAAIAERDAFEIHAACKGLGTSESRIIDVVCARSKAHIFKVDMIYRERYGKSLIELFESECSGDFLKFAKYVVMPETVFDVYQTIKATMGLGTNEALLIETLASRSPSRVLKIKAKMDARGTPLIDLINSELSGDVKKVCLYLVQGRSEAAADEDLAQQQAEQLYEAGVGQWGTNEKKFIDIIGSASLAQCDAIRKGKWISMHSIEVFRIIFFVIIITFF